MHEAAAEVQMVTLCPKSSRSEAHGVIGQPSSLILKEPPLHFVHLFLLAGIIPQGSEGAPGFLPPPQCLRKYFLKGSLSGENVRCYIYLQLIHFSLYSYIKELMAATAAVLSNYCKLVTASKNIHSSTTVRIQVLCRASGTQPK